MISMRKIFIGLTLIFFVYCWSHEFNYVPKETPSLSPEILSPQTISFFPHFCDAYKHRNSSFYYHENLSNYTAQQLQHYFHKNNYSEKQILDQELLYLSDEFIKLAKTYAGYTQAIERLHKKFSKFGPGKKILHTFTGTYASGLKLKIKRLYQEIQCKKEYQEGKIVEQIAEYCELELIYKQYCPLLSQSIQKRIKAKHNNLQELQRIIDLESIDIVDRANLLPSYSILYSHQEALIDCAISMGDYNKQGLVHKAMCVADFCWTLLDYGQAIAEGAAMGLYSAAHDILTNPIEATASIIAGKQILTFQLYKVFYTVAEIGVAAITNFDGAQEKWNQYTGQLNNIIDAINKKEIAVRDVIKNVTAFVIGYKAQDKLLGGLGKFCNSIRHKSINCVKNNPLLHPQEYLATPEGLLFKAIGQSGRLEQSKISSLKKNIENKVAKHKSIKRLIKQEGLPTKGKLRYVPPKKLHSFDRLPHEKLPGRKIGFIDRFGNLWVQGESRTKGQAHEWDVQLSRQGIQQVGWMTRDSTHLNVSLDGRVTHK